MRLKLDPPDPSGVLRVRCIGQICQAYLNGPADPLIALISPEGLKLTVQFDLEQVTYIDSSGIGWLVGSHRRFTEAGGRLVLCRVPPVVEQVLQFCSLEDIFLFNRDA